jgi:hypothetical protein
MFRATRTRFTDSRDRCRGILSADSSLSESIILLSEMTPKTIAAEIAANFLRPLGAGYKRNFGSRNIEAHCLSK